MKSCEVYFDVTHIFRYYINIINVYKQRTSRATAGVGSNSTEVCL